MPEKLKELQNLVQLTNRRALDAWTLRLMEIVEGEKSAEIIVIPSGSLLDKGD